MDESRVPCWHDSWLCSLFLVVLYEGKCKIGTRSIHRCITTCMYILVITISQLIWKILFSCEASSVVWLTVAFPLR